jgi:hypothetical protein
LISTGVFIEAAQITAWWKDTYNHQIIIPTISSRSLRFGTPRLVAHTSA